MPRSYFLYAVLVALAASFVAPFLGLGLGGGLLASWTAFGWWRWAYNLAGSGKFVKMTPEVYRWVLRVGGCGVLLPERRVQHRVVQGAACSAFGGASLTRHMRRDGLQQSRRWELRDA